MHHSLSTRAKRLEQRRRQAARYFQQGYSQAWVAKRLRVSRPTVHDWYWRWDKDGIDGLASRGPSGAQPKLSRDQLRSVERLLLQGAGAVGYETDLWTLGRVRDVIRKRTRVVYHPGHVWKILHALGWSSQKPVRRARERDEAAIAHWQKVTWPVIQKRGSASV